MKIDCKNKKCKRGAILVYNDQKGYWGPMCSQGWTHKEAGIACRSLNFR